MPHVTEYVVRLGPDVNMYVRHVTVNGTLVSYAVTVALSGADARAIRVFDNAHGSNEMHRYTREGEKLPAEEFHRGTASEAMNAARKWIHEGWSEMVEPWLR